jgi:hypothetical protein
LYPGSSDQSRHQLFSLGYRKVSQPCTLHAFLSTSRYTSDDPYRFEYTLGPSLAYSSELPGLPHRLSEIWASADIEHIDDGYHAGSSTRGKSIIRGEENYIQAQRDLVWRVLLLCVAFLFSFFDLCYHLYSTPDRDIPSFTTWAISATSILGTHRYTIDAVQQYQSQPCNTAGY